MVADRSGTTGTGGTKGRFTVREERGMGGASGWLRLTLPAASAVGV